MKSYKHDLPEKERRLLESYVEELQAEAPGIEDGASPEGVTTAQCILAIRAMRSVVETAQKLMDLDPLCHRTPCCATRQAERDLRGALLHYACRMEVTKQK